jgi:predicted RNase H-like nuclease
MVRRIEELRSIIEGGRPDAAPVWVAGVDGCRGGWVVALAAYRAAEAMPSAMRTLLCERFGEVLALAESPRAIAVDMPIGLPERFSPGGRACDRAARAVLGPGWTASVFSPPARAALHAGDHAEAMRRQGGGLSLQAFNLVPKIREVDAAITPDLQGCVIEAHPELVFRGLNGDRALRHRKKTPAGVRERMRLLRAALGPRVPDPARTRLHLGLRAMAPDDVVDAWALADAARRFLCGAARRVPEGRPATDARGLRMEIWS